MVGKAVQLKTAILALSEEFRHAVKCRNTGRLGVCFILVQEARDSPRRRVPIREQVVRGERENEPAPASFESFDISLMSARPADGRRRTRHEKSHEQANELWLAPVVFFLEPDFFAASGLECEEMKRFAIAHQAESFHMTSRAFRRHRCLVERSLARFQAPFLENKEGLIHFPVNVHFPIMIG